MGWERINRNSPKQASRRRETMFHGSVPMIEIDGANGLKTYAALKPGITYKRNGRRDVDLKRENRRMRRIIKALDALEDRF